MKKPNILNKAQAFKSACANFGEDPNKSLKLPTRLPSAIENGADLLPFILDLAIIIKGAPFVKDLLKEMLSDFLEGFLDEFKATLKTALHNLPMSSQKIGDTECLTAGLEIPMRYIDMMRRLKGNGRKLDSFETALKDSIIGGVPMKVDGYLTIEYIQASDSIIARADISVLDDKVSDMMEALGDGFDLDEDGIIDGIIDILFGIFPNFKGKLDGRDILERYLDEEEPEELKFTRFDFNSALGTPPSAKTYISSIDCDGQPYVLSEEDIDGLYNSQDLVESVYSLMKDVGSIPSDAQSGKLGKDLFRALLLAILERILIYPSAVFRNLIYVGLDGDCRFDVKFADPAEYLKANIRRLSCLIKKLRDAFLNKVLDIIEREIRDLAICLAQTYAKERVEGYVRAISTL